MRSPADEAEMRLRRRVAAGSRRNAVSPN